MGFGIELMSESVGRWICVCWVSHTAQLFGLYTKLIQIRRANRESASIHRRSCLKATCSALFARQPAEIRRPLLRGLSRTGPGCRAPQVRFFHLSFSSFYFIFMSRQGFTGFPFFVFWILVFYIFVYFSWVSVFFCSESRAFDFGDLILAWGIDQFPKFS